MEKKEISLDELFTIDALDIFADRNTDEMEYNDFTDMMRERAWLINGRFGQRCEANGVKVIKRGRKYFASIR